MEQTAANNAMEDTRRHLRRAGLLLLAFPLSTIAGMIYYFLAPRGEVTLHAEPIFLVFAFFAYRFLRGDPRHVATALVLCWLCLITGPLFIAGALLFQQSNVTLSAFIVLFQISKKNALLALGLNLLCFGLPIIPLTLARRS